MLAAREAPGQRFADQAAGGLSWRNTGLTPEQSALQCFVAV